MKRRKHKGKETSGRKERRKEGSENRRKHEGKKTTLSSLMFSS